MYLQKFITPTARVVLHSPKDGVVDVPENRERVRLIIANLGDSRVSITFGELASESMSLGPNERLTIEEPSFVGRIRVSGMAIRAAVTEFLHE